MLNIPEEVKALFKTSDVKKNIRISFPNGERADITNENLIAESLSFTESVCSQESLKFGLIESPVLEFETAGIENIKGKEIEVEIDIDTTTVPEANFTLPLVNSSASFEVLAVSKVAFHGHKLEDISWDIKVLDGVGVNDPFGLSPVQTFESEPAYGSPSNEVYCGFDVRFGAYKGHRLLVTVTSEKDVEEIAISYDVGMTSDSLDFKYYPIKLGRFIVESSPKQADMSRRKVAAYGLSYASFNQLSSVEQAKRNVDCNKNIPYKFDAIKYFYSLLTYDYTIPHASYMEEDWYAEDYGMTYLGYGSVSGKRIYFYDESMEKALYHLKCDSEYSIKTLRDEIESYFDRVEPSAKDVVLKWYDKNAEEIFYPSISYLYEFAPGYWTQTGTGYIKGEKYLYPYASSGWAYDDNHERRFFVPTKLIVANPLNKEQEFEFELRKNPKIERVQLYTSENVPVEPIWLEIKRSKIPAESKYVVTEQIHYPLQVAEALIEMQGAFGVYDRYGKFTVLNLADNFANVNGGSISKSEYESVWYEDKTSYPYGLVSATYKTASGEEEYAVYNIPKGFSRGNIETLKEVSADSEVYFLWLNVSTGTMLPESGHLMIEAPCQIESVMIGFDYYALPLEFEGKPNIVEISSDDFYFPDITEISLTLETQESYSGNVVLSSFESVEEHYKADECIQYDISNNYLIQNCTFTQEQIETVLKEFAEAIKNIRYMPCELDLVGLPYIEAGDVVEVETEAGNFITLVERRTLNGIQSLRDAWQSQASDEHIIIGESSSYGGGSSGGGEGAVTSVNGCVGNVLLKTSDLTNDSNYVADSKYVHTDNNFTAEYKEKVDSNTTASHAHSNKTVLDGITQAHIDKWNAGGGGGGDSTIRYNAETDMIQLFGSDGIWHDWISGGLKATMLYDNGVQNVQFDFGHVWRYNSYSYKDSVAEETSINITGTSSAGSSVTGTSSVYDITDYNTLVFEVTNNSVAMTLEVDISDLTGSYYIGFGYRYADKEVVYGVTSSKNIGTGSVRTIKKAVSAHTTYINEIKLRK